MKHCRGVTLIELIVAIAVLAILLAVAAPSFQTWMSNQQMRNISESIQNGIRTAQMEAVRRNQPVTFWMVSNMSDSCTLSAGSSWIVALQNPTGTEMDGKCASNDTDAFIQKTPRTGSSAGVAVATTPANANCITFNGFGQVVSGGATCASPITSVTTSTVNPSRSLVIQITNGNIRLCDPSQPSTDARGCK